jgi:O-antigen/teichoic acid export membrane protein
MTFTRAIAEAVALVSVVVLARLISPSEFGRAAIAMIIPVLAAVLTFEGFGSALVQRDVVEPRHLKTAATLGLATGVVLGVVTAVLGPLAAKPLFGSGTADLVRLAAPSFLISGFSVVQTAELQRRLDFRTLTVSEVAGLSAGALSSIGFAAAGLNGSAIVLGTLVAALVSRALITRAAPPPGYAFDRGAARDLLGFGAKASVQGLAWTATRNVDYAIVGARLGPAALGFYWRAYTFGVEYQNKISRIMTKIAFPLYSRTEGRDHMSAVHSRVMRVHAAVLFPVLAMLIATAPVLIPWLLGHRWEPAVEPTQILAVAGMVLALIAGFGQAALAAGKPGALLVNNLFSLAVYAPVVYFAAPHGLVTLSIAVTVTIVFTGNIAAYLLLDRAVGIPMKRIYVDAAPATAGAVALLALSLPLTRALDDAGVPAVPVLASAGIVGLAAYLVVVRLISPAAWADLRLLFDQVMPARLRPRKPPRVRRESGAAAG